MFRSEPAVFAVVSESVRAPLPEFVSVLVLLDDDGAGAGEAGAGDDGVSVLTPRRVPYDSGGDERMLFTSAVFA